MHYVPHAKHMESCPLDEMAKCSQDDDSDFEDVSGVTHLSTNTKLWGLRGLEASVSFSRVCTEIACAHHII